MTNAHLQILQHSLGVDQYGQGPMYRNHFCAGGTDIETCRELIALGYMRKHATTQWLPYFNCSVTEAGKTAMLKEKPQSPKVSRSQERYHKFLKAL